MGRGEASQSVITSKRNDAHTDVKNDERNLGEASIMFVYSDHLVALVRSLDSAEVSVRAANCHFSNVEMDHPKQFHDAGGYHAWAWGNSLNLEATLPGLRSFFLSKVREESRGVLINPNGLGDAYPPDEIKELFGPVTETDIYFSTGGLSPAKKLELPNEIRAECGNSRVVEFDGQVFIIPESFTDSFVEVWFRRAYSDWTDGGAYPMYLTKRAYGWQAYGIEL